MRSLSVRLFLIVLGGVILAIAISNLFHHHDRARFIEGSREYAAVEHLRDAIGLLAPLNLAARASAVRTLRHDTWQVDLGARAETTVWEVAPGISQKLSERLAGLASVEGAWREHSSNCKSNPMDCFNSVRVKVRFPEGQTTWLSYAPKHFPWPHRHAGPGFRDRDWFLIGVMAVVAWLVVRLALRPLQRMTRAVERFGRDMHHPPIDESGPQEVRRAAQAFNTMQQQILGYMAERTQILAAVTHDLKTPMTRMRMRLENCADDTLRERLQADLAAMQSLVEEGLELARSLESNELSQLVDIDALLQSLCDNAVETGLDVAYEGINDQMIVVNAQPNALRRVFENIIDNAVKYGHRARLSLEIQNRFAKISIQDSGPGIDEKELQNVIKPFVRLESSRSRETGGTGLGLAIADNLLRLQKGQMSLRNLPQGGLEVSVLLPVATLRK
jgi:signal transduction histidine kinase